MDKGLYLKLLGRIGSYLVHIAHRRFAREHDAACPHIVQNARRCAVYDAELGADMPLRVGSVFFGSLHNAEVGYYKRVDSGIFSFT